MKPNDKMLDRSLDDSSDQNEDFFQFNIFKAYMFSENQKEKNHKIFDLM